MKLTLVIPIALAIVQIFQPAGLNFRHHNSPTSQKYLIETMGAGVAVLDYNNDGLLDVFFVDSGSLDDPQKGPPNFARRHPTYWNRLYRQNRDGSFTDVTAAAGLSVAGNNYGMGVAVADYDNDGFSDIYVTNYGRNVLYRNARDGTFIDATEQAQVAGGGWSVSAAFLDYDNDSRLDLFVTRYLDYELSGNIICGTPFNSYCRPERYGGMTNLLYHNEGKGRFRDVSESSGIASVKGKGMGVAINDYDGDGFADIFVSNDLIEQYLFHNGGNGTFRERALEAGVALSDDGKPYSGMGAAFADYDNDGRPDIVVTNLALEKWALYHNDGDGQFSYATLTTGLAKLVARNSGWGVGFHDFDNDGWKDLFAAQSHVLDNVERINSGLRYLEPPGLYRNASGKFEAAEIGALPSIAGRGVAFGDLNNDGAMDAVVAVLGARPIFLRARPNSHHWLTLNLVGTRSNRDGLGARVRTGRQVVYSTTSGSYLSANDRRVHFGLGSDTQATIEINWPSGRRQTLGGVTVDRILTVKEPE
jgi:enediyne biosynthesis protein E4